MITFRPEFTPPWIGQPHVTLLSLNRLSPRRRAEMIASLTGGKALPKEIADQIVDRTDGVPLFIEELTKAVVESGVLADAGDRYTLAGPLPPLAIPTSLNASLLARLDRSALVRDTSGLGWVQCAGGPTWIRDDAMRRAVHKCTTKIERHHRFAKHLAFGGEGLLQSNDPADQEKAIIYNELVANAVVLQNVVDQTQTLHALKSEGVAIEPADLPYLSPYATRNLKRFGDYPTELKPEPARSCGRCLRNAMSRARRLLCKENQRIAAALDLRVRQLICRIFLCRENRTIIREYCSAALESLLSAETDYRPPLGSY
jgi:Tn3 transposase DDE domain-containing protein